MANFKLHLLGAKLKPLTRICSPLVVAPQTANIQESTLFYLMRCNGNLVDTVDTLQTDNPTCINLLQLVHCSGVLAESTLIYLMRFNGDNLNYLQTDNPTCTDALQWESC